MKTYFQISLIDVEILLVGRSETERFDISRMRCVARVLDDYSRHLYERHAHALERSAVLHWPDW